MCVCGREFIQSKAVNEVDAERDVATSLFEFADMPGRVREFARACAHTQTQRCWHRLLLTLTHIRTHTRARSRSSGTGRCGMLQRCAEGWHQLTAQAEILKSSIYSDDK